jgi:NADH-quinone oxidoreductase subunit N
VIAVPAFDVGATAPVLACLAGIVVVLLLDAAVGRLGEQPSPLLRRLLDLTALVALLGAGAAVVWLARAAGHGGPVKATLCIPGDGLVLPSCSYVVSGITLALQGITVAAAVVCLLLALDGDGAGERTGHHVLFLTAVAGVLVLAAARDLLTMVVALETASLPAVGLVALRRDEHGARGALTLLLTAVASLAVLLLGVAMLLLATGTVWLDRLAVTLAAPSGSPAVRALAVLGLLLVVSGVAFKMSLVPFHLWTPDTYAGAPLPVAAFLSVVSKTGAAAMLLVLLGVGLPMLAGLWAPILGVLAAVTMTVGNLVALRQTRAVRLLAWSTVAQAGWVVLPLAGLLRRSPGGLGDQLGVGQGDVLGVAHDAVAASVGYLAAYAAAGLAVFAVVVVFARHHSSGERHTLDDYRGLARREPVAAAVLGFGLACLAGLPPGIVGVVAKVIALRPVVDAGWWLLAAVAAANIALALAYYLRWAALLVAAPDGEVPTWRLRPAEGLAVGAGAAACVALSIAPQAIASLVPTLLR